MKKNKKKKLTRQMLIRILAIVMVAALLVTMAITVVSSSYGEEIRDTSLIELELQEERQALRVTQRLSFTNRTGRHLDRVLFAIYANQFRRASTVMYEDISALPAGYYPGGAEFLSVCVDGQEADWAAEGDGEYFLRVACDLMPGEKCEFFFRYDLLLTENAAFFGVDEDSWRLSGFCPVPALWQNGTWVVNAPMQHCRYTLTSPMDYEMRITLPSRYFLASGGEVTRTDNGDGTNAWEIRCENIREPALLFSRAWREKTGQTRAGTKITVLSASRGGASRALEDALEAANAYESWFGALPMPVTLAQTRIVPEKLSFSGCIWLDEKLFESGAKEEMKTAVRRALAEQYFGLSVYADPVADAWLCDSVCEYLSYLVCEEAEGPSAFYAKLDANLTDALTVTMPGSLFITADASLFSGRQYDIVVRRRGAAALHEFRGMTGRETFLGGLRTYYEENGGGEIVTEMEFLSAFREASGRDWEDALADLFYNIEEYGRGIIRWDSP